MRQSCGISSCWQWVWLLGADALSKFKGFEGMKALPNPPFAFVHCGRSSSSKRTFSTTCVSTILHRSESNIRERIARRMLLEVTNHGRITSARASARFAFDNVVPARIRSSFALFLSRHGEDCSFVLSCAFHVFCWICCVFSSHCIPEISPERRGLFDHFSHLNLRHMFEAFLVEDLSTGSSKYLPHCLSKGEISSLSSHFQ